MFIEQRTYTLKPGRLSRFWELQSERGFQVVRPLMERLVGYFGRRADGFDQVVHLWRFDDYDDWVARLHGLYAKPELQPYFTEVRSLMLRQENAILTPAPASQLTPLIGNGSDWLPGGTAAFIPCLENGSLIAIETLQFRPGTLNAFWGRLSNEDAAEVAAGGLIGAFTTIIGELHKLVVYRPVKKSDELTPPVWEAVLRDCRDFIVGRDVSVYERAPLAELSPLWARERFDG